MGAGDNGDVYRATDVQTGEVLALKNTGAFLGWSFPVESSLDLTHAIRNKIFNFRNFEYKGCRWARLAMDVIGILQRSKSRNLLDRFDAYEAEVLRFMDNPIVPFTNNPAENDIRMTKVQQKISGCFRSMEGAYIFCRVRSYLVTCRKQNIKMIDALEIVFKGELPGFANSL